MAICLKTGDFDVEISLGKVPSRKNIGLYFSLSMIWCQKCRETFLSSAKCHKFNTFLKPLKVLLSLSAGKPSTLVSKNWGKTPTTPSGKLKGKMLAARKVKAPLTSSSESGSEDNDEDFVANPKEEKRRKVARAKVSFWICLKSSP